MLLIPHAQETNDWNNIDEAIFDQSDKLIENTYSVVIGE